METFLQWWHAVPGLWALVTFVIGGSFTFAISWRSLREYNTDLKAERDDYRKNLHHERDEHQKTRLILTEFEGRPNLVSMETLLKVHTEVLAAHMKEDHIAFQALNRNLEATNDLLGKTGITLEKLNAKL